MADGDTTLIPVDPANPYPLGRHQFHSPANRLHRALDAPAAEQPARTRPWNTTWLGDQGIVPAGPPPAGLHAWPTGTCTAYAAVGVARTQPNTAVFNRRHYRNYDTPEERIGLYLHGQGVDPWDGSELVDPRYEGSSTEAPFRVLRDRGEIPGWVWLFGEQETRYYVQHVAPFSAGTVWRAGMFTPRPDGSLPVTGEVVGGHAYRIVYYDPRRHRYLKVGSWGYGWGRRGTAWIDGEDFAALLADGGEAAAIRPAA